MAGLADQIEQKLRKAFEVTSLEVINESHMHSGHAGDNGTGESHFRIRIQAKEFDTQSRVQQHRAINKALSEELAGHGHALAIDVGKSL